jgi:GDPmannose 4,6-dehydratase
VVRSETADRGPKTGDVIVRVDPHYFRPAEVETLLGDATKARQRLGWSPRISFETLVHEMVTTDLRLAERDALVAERGYKIYRHHE